MTGRDLRLAPLALGSWLAAYAALLTSLSTAVTITTAATAAALVFRRKRIVCLALIGVALGAGATAARLAIRDDPAITRLVDDKATIAAEMVVRDDPRSLPGRTPSWLIDAELTRADDLRLSVPVLVIASGDGDWRALLPGQRMAVTGRLGATRGGDLQAAVLAVNRPPRLIGRAPWAQRAAGSLRAGLQKACAGLEPRRGGLLPGLVVGDTSRLPPEVQEDFKAAGMTHLTAVSGSNVAIIIGCLLLFLRWCRASPAICAAACVLGVAGFVILARPSPSVLRAAVMGGLALAALATGRGRAALPALSATVAILVVVDPELAADAGFTLSVCATAGLLLLAPGWRDALQRRLPRIAAEALAVPAAAQVACAPVIAALSGSVSLIAIPANLLATAAVAPATVLGVLAAAISPIWPPGAEFAAWLASYPAAWLVTVARVAAGLPGAALPWPSGTPGAVLLAGLTVMALVGFRSAKVRRVVLVVTAAAVLGAAPVRLLAPGWPPKGWLVVACDVGQGDATVLRTQDGAAVVVDAGPEPAAVAGCLDRLGITTVPLLVISHFHADHVGGVAGVFRGRRVSAVLTPAWPEPVEGRTGVLAAASAARSPVSVAAPGEVRRIGPLTMTVTGPVTPLRGTRSDPNNNSIVLSVSFGGTSVLLTGDAEVEEQQELVAAGVGRADVLKVAHHGSAFQDPAFLAAVAPAIALVSVGAGNDYGHPNPAVLASLTRGGARVVRTDQAGDVAIAIDAGQLTVTPRS
ncbi:ComEC/Rec2 family competence protein [Hamadaea sp. NPDC051192]|uniref:ComEC/Rec2 family competence protein n=1 Tax=Hamadaea sp. NPDC051192 TaxID=3154940 RepID=UPI003446521E